MNFRFVLLALVLSGAVLRGDSDIGSLPAVTVYSPRVANQTPVAAFAMPVSALRFEPRVDIQARNFAEGQADVTIRGGIFESTGFSIGGASLYDPQTGHYFAEIPVAPAMLGPPRIITGADLALDSFNATAGAIAYDWRPIRTAGAASVGTGQYGLTEAEFYQGYLSDLIFGGRRLAADVAWAHSDANGSVPYGDHVLNRINGRLQLLGNGAQTDFFAGYQAKFFGWPNLYTPFNSDESENLHTLLVALNHRADLGGGDFAEFAAYYRRNRDDYAFNRFAAVGPVRPFYHTTWVRDVAASGRETWADVAWNGRAEVMADELESTSLTFGRFHTRTLTKLSLAPEKSWGLPDGGTLVVKAGATYDDGNRDRAAVSPLFEIAREAPGPLSRIYVSYAQASQVPTYTALDSNPAAGLFRGNPDLGRETSRNFEVGGRADLDGWATQAAVFYRRDDDLVDWTYRRGVTARSANAVDVATTGFELVTRRSWRRCDLVLGYTWLTKQADYRGALVDASFYALNYARQRLTAAITAHLTREFELRLDNELRVQAANLLRTRGGDRPILSSLGLTFRPTAAPRFSITLQVDNLWASTFQEVPAVPAARRQSSVIAAYLW